ncbi:hypothetical protein BN1058_02825 [Paraliobacillus sp. PM-2]|uniref:hypothetical protein n=1 Tax=Paraliobacillus sp. PM-2 TaxID=1462524 RepID=UPI00061BF50D|nr:hypothetical protein [Paraliobacillus sp. PM-2]CQR48456.1 hypothetical protein BN1058_02825 [Paraliobacillus sp. PM-2]
MIKKWSILLLLLFFIFILAGCKGEEASNNVDAKADGDAVLYENKIFDISIAHNSDWKFKSETESDNLNVILSHGKSQAIISSVSSNRTFEDIKQELKAGTKNIEVISEENKTLSYKSKLKDAVRTDIFFVEHNKSINLIVIFMSPASAYEQAKPNMESLLNHINNL